MVGVYQTPVAMVTAVVGGDQSSFWCWEVIVLLVMSVCFGPHRPVGSPSRSRVSLVTFTRSGIMFASLLVTVSRLSRQIVYTGNLGLGVGFSGGPRFMNVCK